MKIVGIQPYCMRRERWLDFPISWLKAFDILGKEGHDTFAILGCHDNLFAEKGFWERRNNTNYGFVHKPTYENIHPLLINLQPDTIYLCDPDLLARDVAKVFNKSNIILRLHTEVATAFRHLDSLDILNHIGHLIIPQNRQAKDVPRPIDSSFILSTLPFGIEVDYLLKMRESVDSPYEPTFQRDIDFLSSCAPDRKLKASEIVIPTFELLKTKGYTVRNPQGIERGPFLAKWLCRGKVFYYPSLVEASGSRVLLEAMALGLYPVVDMASQTCRELVEELGGDIIYTGAKHNDYCFESFSKHPMHIASQLENILHSDRRMHDQLDKILCESTYNIEVEAKKLAKLMLE